MVVALAPTAGGQGGGGMDAPLLDDVIRGLLEVRTARPRKQVQLSEVEIHQLGTVSCKIFLRQHNLLELEAPIKIRGEHPSSPSSPYLFLAYGLQWW
jgi:serine/threonine-protein phosphatase PP1 catalytic subunit